MGKDFTEGKLLEKNTQQQLKVLFDLSRIIELNLKSFTSDDFLKLTRYHNFLKNSDNERITKINKEFFKIKDNKRQFQVYIMNLERFLGQSSKDYDFLVSTGDYKQASQLLPIACLLDSVRSAHNIGAIFRNMDCFGMQELILCGLSPTPDIIQVKKTAMGSEKLVKWQYQRDAIDVILNLKDQGFTIWSIETSNQAIDINKISKIPTPLVLVFGHEQHGISHEILKLSDKIINIPLYGAKNSLNVSICHGVILNAICSQSQ